MDETSRFNVANVFPFHLLLDFSNLCNFQKHSFTDQHFLGLLPAKKLILFLFESLRNKVVQQVLKVSRVGKKLVLF